MRLSFSVFCVAMAALCAVDADQLRGTLTSANTAAAVNRVLAVDEQRALGTGDDNRSSDVGANSDDASDDASGKGKGKGGSKGADADEDSDEDESESKGGKVCTY